MILEPGDVVLTRSRKPLGRIIRYLTRRPGEPRSRVNHAAMVVVGGELFTHGVVQVVEAVDRVRQKPLLPRDSHIAVFRLRNFSSFARTLPTKAMLARVGEYYGYATLLTHAFDWLLCGEYVFRRLTRHGVTCSGLVASALAFIGVSPSKLPWDAVNAVSPDDIWDWVKGHPDAWECIYSEVE